MSGSSREILYHDFMLFFLFRFSSLRVLFFLSFFFFFWLVPDVQMGLVGWFSSGTIRIPRARVFFLGFVWTRCWVTRGLFLGSGGLKNG